MKRKKTVQTAERILVRIIIANLKLVFKDEMNQILAENIRFVCVYYDRSRVFDETSLLKHLIATKQIKVDMETQLLDIPTLLETYRNLLSTLTDYYSLIINGKEN